MSAFNYFELFDVGLRDLLDLLLTTCFFYILFQLFRGTRAVQMFWGFLLLVILYSFVEWLDLKSMRWVFSKLVTVGVIAFIIVFQPEMRSALLRLGQNTNNRFWKKNGFGSRRSAELAEMICLAIQKLKNEKAGALIVLGRSVGLKTYVDSGILLNAEISTHLLLQIFHVNTPLHDGAVIINKDKIVAAACTLPVSNPVSSKLGLRHRAALGISGETDADVIVLSEETGDVSFVTENTPIRIIDIDELEMKLLRYFLNK